MPIGVGNLVVAVPPSPDVPSLLDVSHDEQMQNPGLNPTIWSVRNGRWSNGETWSTGGLPTANDRVVISHNVEVTNIFAVAGGVYVWGDGLLSFAVDVDTRLTVTTLVVDDTGTLRIGTVAAPIEADVVAEILIRNVALPSQSDDPRQFYNGVLCFGESTVRMYGAVKTTDASSLRLAVEPLADATTLTMAGAPSGWRIGDKVAIPASDPQQIITTGGVHELGFPYLGETFTITDIDAAVITLDGALENDHPGARDRNGAITFLPHVVNLTRNVRIRSENPNGVRGHVLFGDRADVRIFYAAAVELGRTTAVRKQPPGDTFDTFDNATFSGATLTHYGLNQAGRYPWHFHHLMGPVNIPNTGYQFELVGCSVDGGKKWGITLHGASYGRIEANNIWNCQAAGVSLEGGNEAYNYFAENTSMEIVGIPGQTVIGLDPGDGTGTSVNNGYWMLGASQNTWINNVAAGCNGNSAYLGHGFHLDGLNRGGHVTGGGNTPGQYPLFRGADVDEGVEGVDYELVGKNTSAFADFTGNESYGALKSFSIDHYHGFLGTLTYTNCKSWATYNEAWFIYGGSGNLTLVNPVIRRTIASAFAPNTMKKCTITVTGGDIQTVIGRGVEWAGGNDNLDDIPNHIIFENCLIAAPMPALVQFSTQSAIGTLGPPDLMTPSKTWLFRNCLLINTDAGAELIRMDTHVFATTEPVDPMMLETVHIEDHQQSLGEDYQLFWNEQAPSAAAPGPGDTSGYACPVDGLTNQQCFDTYGRAFGGELMPGGAATKTWLTGGKALTE